MTDTPQVLLAHHLKTLKLPTFLREYDKLARQCATEGADHVRYLVRLTELRAVRCDGAGQDVDRFLDPGKRLVLVPDLAVVELAGTRGRAEQGGLFASHCGL